MTYRLTLATVEERDLVVTSLRTAADQRARVARKAATEVIAEKGAGKDARSGAVKVTALLHEANQLATIADQLEQAPELVILRDALDPAQAEADRLAGPGIVDAATGKPADPLDLEHLDDDGTSPEAQALAKLAGLEPANPDAPAPVEDPETHELPEDRPKPEDVVDVATTALGDPDATDADE